MLISLLLLLMSVQGRHTIRIFNIGSAYQDRRTRKTAWVGAFLSVSWYWVSTLALYIVDGFTIALMPSLGSLGNVMLDYISISLDNPGLALIFAIVGGLSMWMLEALYYVREILLYVYVYGMPIAFALAYGNIPVLSTIAMGFSKRFVPLAILPLPAAVIFKGYDLLYSTGGLTPDSLFLKYIVATSLPLLALYVTWKTFTYATPLTAKVVGTATRGAVLAGGIAAGAYVGGGAATAAARWGPKAAAGHAIAQKVSTRRTPTRRAATRGEGSDDSNDSQKPAYRRTENDPPRVCR